MKTLIVLALTICAASALPLAQLSNEEIVEVKSTTTPVPIIKSINQVNDDGSYTFGYEAGDGSFRIEKKELSGHVQGKYGYVDEFGVLQVLEYQSGKNAGKSLGFQPTGALSPFPVQIQESSPEQKQLDFQYSSVDEDEDGVPDDQQRRIANNAGTRTSRASPAAPVAVQAFFPQPVSDIALAASVAKLYTR